MSGDEKLLLSLVIPTVDRGPAITETIASVLRNDFHSFELYIVDQSAGDGVRDHLAPYLDHSRVHYIKSETRGVAHARNIGARHAKSSLIAFTDDDCIVPETWMDDVVRAFRDNGPVGMVFGNVQAGPHSRERGFIQSYVREQPFLARSLRDKHRIEGIGACMAVRRSVFEELGGFDPQLGTGARFRAAEETDLTVRALLAGYPVYGTPAVSVVHHGFRTWEERPSIIWNYLYGIGAMSAKHLKSGNFQVLSVMFHLGWRWAFAGPMVDLGGPTPRIFRLRAFLRGMAAGAASKVDRATGKFLP